MSRIDRIVMNLFNFLTWLGNPSNLWLIVGILLVLLGLRIAEAQPLVFPEVVGWNARQEDLDLFVAESRLDLDPGQLVMMYNVGAHRSRPACIINRREAQYNLVLSIAQIDLDTCERFKPPVR